MEGRYKKSGWFYEPERHNLARQGIKTKLKPIGLAAAKGVVGFIDVTREGLTQEIPTEGDITYQPVTIASINDLEKEDKVMKDVDSIVAEEKVEIEVPEQIVSLPEEQIQPEYSSGVDNEVLDVEIAMEGSTLSRGWFDKAKDWVTEKVKDVISSSRDNKPEALSTHLGEIEAHKISLGDKIQIIQKVKVKVMSEQYKTEAGAQKQLENVSKLNRYVEQLRGEISNIDHKVTLGKKQLTHLQTMPVITQKKEGIFSGIFPSFGEILSPGKLTEKKETRKSVFVEEKKREPMFVNVFPNFDEILHPEKLKR